MPGRGSRLRVRRELRSPDSQDSSISSDSTSIVPPGSMCRCLRPRPPHRSSNCSSSVSTRNPGNGARAARARLRASPWAARSPPLRAAGSTRGSPTPPEPALKEQAVATIARPKPTIRCAARVPRRLLTLSDSRPTPRPRDDSFRRGPIMPRQAPRRSLFLSREPASHDRKGDLRAVGAVPCRASASPRQGPWWLPAAYGPKRSSASAGSVQCSATSEPATRRLPGRGRQTSGPGHRRQRRSWHAVLSRVHAASKNCRRARHR